MGSTSFKTKPFFGIMWLDCWQLTSLSSTAGEWKAALWKLVSLRASQNGPFLGRICESVGKERLCSVQWFDNMWEQTFWRFCLLKEHSWKMRHQIILKKIKQTACKDFTCWPAFKEEVPSVDHGSEYPNHTVTQRRVLGKSEISLLSYQSTYLGTKVDEISFIHLKWKGDVNGESNAE